MKRTISALVLLLVNLAMMLSVACTNDSNTVRTPVPPPPPRTGR